MSKKITHEQKQERLIRFRQLAEAGKSAREIAEDLGVRKNLVHQMSSVLGVVLVRSRSRKSKYRGSRAFDILKELFHNSAQSDAEISRGFECTREYVGQVRGWMLANKVVRG